MGAEPGRVALGFRRSKCAPAEDHGARVPRHARSDAQAPRAAPRRSDERGSRPRGRSNAGARLVPVIWLRPSRTSFRSNNSVPPNSLPGFRIKPLKLGFLLQNYLAEKK